VSRRVTLPTDQAVQAALQTLLAETAANDTRPTVLELTRRLGLTNTTFWRHFPEIGAQLRDITRTPPQAGSSSPAAQRLAHLEQRNAELTRDNRQLTEHLEMAVDHIRRLSLDNHQLRHTLATSSNITPID